MYFERVYIENYRGIENITLDFQPGVNILIGDNGTGKTTILEALATALGGYLLGVQNLKVGGLLQEDFRCSIHKLAGASSQIKYHPPKIEFDLNIENSTLHGSRSRNSRDGSARTLTSVASQSFLK